VKIGEAAAASGIGERMIRHYEKIGLMPPAARRDSGYRDYDARNLHTLKFIGRARDAGFPIEEIRQSLALWNDRDFHRGVTVLCWKKLRRYVEEQRQAGWPSLFEWLQWLAERMDERRATSSDVPAFERFKNWNYSGDYERLCAGRGARQGLER